MSELPTDDAVPPGKLGIWLSPDALRWLAKESEYGPDATDEQKDHWARVRVAASSTLQKAGFAERPDLAEFLLHAKFALIEIRRPDGRMLSCCNYKVANTYGNFDIRTPSESCNEQMLKSARQEASGWPGRQTVHIVDPERHLGAVDYPPIQITAMFTASPNNPEFDLSVLTVVWFQDREFPVPDEQAKAALEVLDWNGLASEGSC